MVHCSKCWTKNEEDAKYCVKCGLVLESSPSSRTWDSVDEWGEDIGKRAEKFGKRMENECFGLPHLGAIMGLIFGTFIILIGTSLAMGIDVEHILGNLPWIGGLFIILIGLLIVAGTIYRLTRKRR